MAGEAMFEVPGSRLTEMTQEIARLTRELAEKDALIARLRSEVDEARGVQVEYAPPAGVDAAMALRVPREDGAVLRETGGLQRSFRWLALQEKWEQVP